MAVGSGIAICGTAGGAGVAVGEAMGVAKIGVSVAAGQLAAVGLCTKY